MYTKFIPEEILEESGKGAEKEQCARCSRSLIAVLRMLAKKGESACVEVSKQIYTIALKEWLNVLEENSVNIKPCKYRE